MTRARIVTAYWLTSVVGGAEKSVPAGNSSARSATFDVAQAAGVGLVGQART